MPKLPVANPTGGLVPAIPLAIDEAVRYGDGAIVSRTLHKCKTGTLTLFAFDAGQELSEHTAPFDAVVHVLEGSARLTIGGAPVVVGAGAAVLMPADIPHSVRAEERLRMMLVMFRGG